MRDLMPFALAVVVSTLVVGCGLQAPKADSPYRPDQLTASDLARLMDFHAWKVPVPPAKQEFKEVRLIVVNLEGTVVKTLFDTGLNLRSRPCDSILLGFRLDHGKYVGHLFLRDSRGGGVGWDVDFPDSFEEMRMGWVTAGTVGWRGNHAELGMATKRGDPNSEIILALELVR